MQGIFSDDKAKFEKNELLKMFKGTPNVNNSCYFNVAIRFLSCHPLFYKRLETAYLSAIDEKKNITMQDFIKAFFPKDCGDFFIKLYELIEKEDKEIFKKMYDDYNKKVRLGSETDGRYSQQDPRQEIVTIVDWMNRTYRTIFHINDCDICSNVTYSCSYNKIYCSDEDKLTDFALDGEEDVKITPDIFSVYDGSGKSGKEQSAKATDTNQNYTITLENKKYNDVVMFQKFGSERDKDKVTIRTKDGNVIKNINEISTEDVSSVFIGNDEYVLLSAGLHRGNHWRLYGECDSKKIIFDDDKQYNLKGKEYGDPEYGLGPLMFIKKTSLDNCEVKFFQTKGLSYSEIKEKIVGLTDEEKKSLLNNIRKLETEKINCIREIIKKMIEKNVIEDDGIISEFFTKSDADPIITFSKNFDTNIDEIFSPNDRSKLSAAYEVIRNYFDTHEKKDLSSCTGSIYLQQLSYNDNDYVNKDIAEIQKNRDKIMEFLNSLESKKAENKRDDVIKNNVVKDNDVTPQQPDIVQPFQSNNFQSNNVERNNSNTPYTRQITSMYKYKTPMDYKKPLETRDENKKKDIKKDDEEENRYADIQIEYEKDNMKKIGKRPVIEFWVYLLCIVLIGFYILYLKTKEIDEWDKKKANYDRRIKEWQNMKSRKIDYNLNNSGAKERII